MIYAIVCKLEVVSYSVYVQSPLRLVTLGCVLAANV